MNIDLPEDIAEELDSLLWNYMDAVKEVMERIPDKILLDFIGDYESKSSDFDNYIKSSAVFEISSRRMFEEARPILESETFSGSYCVFHKVDSRDCADKHLEECKDCSNENI